MYDAVTTSFASKPVLPRCFSGRHKPGAVKRAAVFSSPGPADADFREFPGNCRGAYADVRVPRPPPTPPSTGQVPFKDPRASQLITNYARHPFNGVFYFRITRASCLLPGSVFKHRPETHLDTRDTCVPQTVRAPPPAGSRAVNATSLLFPVAIPHGPAPEFS